MISAGSTGTEEPPGMTAFRRRPRRTPPATASSSRTGYPAAVRSCPASPHAPRPKNRCTAGAHHTEIREPPRTVAENRGHRRHGLGVVDGGGRSVETVVGRERRLEARLARLAFQRLQQGSFLAADIGARTDKGVEIEVDAGVVKVVADKTGFAGLAHSGIESLHGLTLELAANVVVAHRGAHGVAADGHALDYRMGVVAGGSPDRGRCRARSRPNCRRSTSGRPCREA